MSDVDPTLFRQVADALERGQEIVIRGLEPHLMVAVLNAFNTGDCILCAAVALRLRLEALLFEQRQEWATGVERWNQNDDQRQAIVAIVRAALEPGGAE